LGALLAHPVIAKVERAVVAGRAGADADHAAGRADEDRSRQRRLAWMLENDPGTDALAQRVPHRLAERAGAFRPLAVGAGVLRVGQGTPVRELAAVDDPRGAVVEAELPLRLIGNDRHRSAAECAGDLERHAPEATRRSPHEHDVAALHDVGRPAHEHAVRRGGAEEEAARFLPGQPLRLRNALMGLAAGELAVAAVVGLIPPDASALRDHRVLARAHPCIARWAEAVLPHAVRVHALRYFADGRALAEIVQVCHVASGVVHIWRRGAFAASGARRSAQSTR